MRCTCAGRVAAPVAAVGELPATVTVTVFVSSWSFGPRTVSVYVVVADGVIRRLPRGVTRPGSGSIVTDTGFSVCHTSIEGWPARIDAGSTENVTIRAGMSRALTYAEPSNPAGVAPGAGFGACARTSDEQAVT